METSGLDRLFSYARELGGNLGPRDRDATAHAPSKPSPPSRSVERDGVKLTLSSLSGAEPPSSAPERPNAPSDERTEAATRETRRPLEARNRAAFSAYDRVRASSPGERIRIRA